MHPIQKYKTIWWIGKGGMMTKWMKDDDDDDMLKMPWKICECSLFRWQKSFVNQIVEFICLCSLYLEKNNSFLSFLPLSSCSCWGMEKVFKFYEKQRTISCKNSIVNAQHQLNESNKTTKRTCQKRQSKRFFVNFRMCSRSPFELNMKKSKRHIRQRKRTDIWPKKFQLSQCQIPSKRIRNKFLTKLLHEFEFSFY